MTRSTTRMLIFFGELGRTCFVEMSVPEKMHEVSLIWRRPISRTNSDACAVLQKMSKEITVHVFRHERKDAASLDF